MTIGNRIFKLHPAILILASFLLAIITGALILTFPIATKSGHIKVIDALFTATSAVCVTGLTVVDTGGYYTIFGQWVILALIQIGGLGVMTISVVLFQWLGRSISFKQRLAMQDLFAHTPRADIFSIVKTVVFFTFLAELIGAVVLTLRWWHELPFTLALYNGIFHSISAFCNAGFSLFRDSLIRYDEDPIFNLTICTLIVIGGIGFPVLYDLQLWIKRRKKQRVRLSIQTKTVLLTTLILIVGGAAMFAFLERNHPSVSHPFFHRIMVSFFQSITCRTAGFNTVDIASLREATLTMMLFLMFFGASPGSCGGGVKTTTLTLLTAFTIQRIRRKKHVSLFKKTIPAETIARSFSLILVSVLLISIVLFLLLAGDSASNRQIGGPESSFLEYLFETVSAFGTVGLSMGITPQLTLWDKSWLILMMIIGRVGVLTFSYIIVGTDAVKGVEYSKENIMIG
jgi:trk system potassium uptake protein TrkH